MHGHGNRILDHYHFHRGSLQIMRSLTTPWIPFQWPYVIRRSLSREIEASLLAERKPTLVFGGLGSGKSTCLREAAQIISKKKPIAVIDLAVTSVSQCIEAAKKMSIKISQVGSVSKATINLINALPSGSAVILMHADQQDLNWLTSDLVKASVGKTVVIEVDGSLQSLWLQMALKDSGPIGIVEVDDFSQKVVSEIFVPKLANDIQLEAVLRVCGGRPSLLQKIAGALDDLEPAWREEQAEIAALVMSGKKQALREDSQKLEIDGLTVSRDRLLQTIGGPKSVFNLEFTEFEKQCQHLMPSADESVLETVFRMESIRYIVRALRRSGSILVTKDPSDLNHPVLLSLLKANFVTIKFLPATRIVPSNNLVLEYLDAWLTVQDENRSFAERAIYNTHLIKHRREIDSAVSNM